MSKAVRKLAFAACFFACCLGGDGRGNRKIRFRGRVVPNHVGLKLGQTKDRRVHSLPQPYRTGTLKGSYAQMRKVQSNLPPPQSSSKMRKRFKSQEAYHCLWPHCEGLLIGTIPRSNRCQQRACRQKKLPNNSFEKLCDNGCQTAYWDGMSWVVNQTSARAQEAR